MITLSELLDMEIDSISPVSGEPIKYSPEFRIAIQSKTEDGIHIIVHAIGHNSDTLDLIVNGDHIAHLGD